MSAWVAASLSRRLTVTVAVVLVVASAAFLALFVGLYRAQLAEEGALASARINRLLQAALENAMVKRDLDGLQTIVTRLGQQEGIAGVMITDPAGEIRFGSDLGVLGRRLSEEAVEAHTRLMVDDRGREVLRSVNPVPNRPVCTQCHGSIADNPVNGILFVDYDAAALRDKATAGALSLAFAGVAILVLTLGLLYGLLRGLVVRPVARLASVAERLGHGDLAARVPDRGPDEIGRLGLAFNAMADSLERSLGVVRRHDAFLQSLLDALPDGVRVFDADYRIVAANRAYCEQIGATLEEVLGRPCYASSHGRNSPCPVTLVTCPLHALQPGTGSIRTVHRHVRSDGSGFFAQVAAARVAVPDESGRTRVLVVEAIRDMSADVDLSHGQRLSEVADLATGVAHEIRNPLVAVRLALRGILQRGGIADEELARYLRVMGDEIDQCIGVADRLLDLTQAPTHGPEPVAVGPALEDAAALLGYEARVSGVELRVQPPPEGTMVWATGPELRMVAVNLMQNAFHAMPRGGTLTVSAAVEGRSVVLRFTDDGVGIAPEIREDIFTPYFSARADGVEGTGMGLSICKGIVETYGGTIAVESEPGAGTTFEIRLPLHVEDQADDAFSG